MILRSLKTSTTALTGNNYLSWSCNIKIGLGAKAKLDFRSGKCEMPDEGSPSYEKWIRVDCMAISWIINSILKDIVEAFLYTISAKDLWQELEERFGECNSSTFYQF